MGITFKQLKHALAALPASYDNKTFHCCEPLNGKIEAICVIARFDGKVCCIEECAKDDLGALPLGEDDGNP